MNEEESDDSISENNTELEAPEVDASVAVTSDLIQDGQTSVQTTYDNFIWILNYTKMFATRLGRDLFESARNYIFRPVVPEHINNLMEVQSQVCKEQELGSASYSSSREQRHFSRVSYPLRNFFQAFRSYIFTSEDDVDLRSVSENHTEISGNDRVPMFVLIDSSGLSNPSSKELLVDDGDKDSVLRKFFNTYIKPTEIPSTSKTLSMPTEHIKESESKDELQMIDINLQSDNEIALDDNVNVTESIVLAYLRNRDVLLDFEGSLLANKKKTSLLGSVPKMETILEGDQLSILKSISQLSSLQTDNSVEDNMELSESSLDVLIPSYPGSPRSINAQSEDSLPSSIFIEGREKLREAVDFLHRDNDLLVAAEIGNDKMIAKLLKSGSDVQQMDHLGRNALHLAVCSDNFRCIEMLIKAGININVKDNLGMTPLSLCLMRRPKMRVASLLFDYGAIILKRTDPVNTGLFIQFVMMCTPTSEEARILRLLVDKGACVNDPEAPGGRQALHFAAMSNNCPLIQILMDLGADMELTNHRGETPKEVARTFKCREAYDLLVELENMDLANDSETTYATVGTIATVAENIKF